MPDFGRFLIKFGKRANIAKGSANEMPKPSIPAVNWYAPPLIDNDPTNKEPSIGQYMRGNQCQGQRHEKNAYYTRY